jgi:hypothetical protein
MSQPDYVGDAETVFRDAFDRLKNGRPTILPIGTPVTQNNVAREANRDPSALRKSRYPKLIRAIQKWIEDNGTGARSRTSSASLLKGARDKNRELSGRIEEVVGQRDTAMARLVIAEDSILQLHQQLQDYKSRVGETDTVVQIDSRAKAKSNAKPAGK